MATKTNRSSVCEVHASKGADMTPRPHINWDEINDALQGLAQDHGIQLDDNTLDELTHHVATVLDGSTEETPTCSMRRPGRGGRLVDHVAGRGR